MDKELIKKVFNDFVDNLDINKYIKLDDEECSVEIDLEELNNTINSIQKALNEAERKKIYMCINGKVTEEEFQEYKNMMKNEYDVKPISMYDYNIFSRYEDLNMELIDTCEELWLFYETGINEEMIKEVEYAHDAGLKIRFATKEGV